MAKKKKNTVERKQLLFRYRIDENGKVSFINPCCDELPAMLFCKVMEAISIVQEEELITLPSDKVQASPGS